MDRAPMRASQTTWPVGGTTIPFEGPTPSRVRFDCNLPAGRGTSRHADGAISVSDRLFLAAYDVDSDRYTKGAEF
jgi:hypothetical protein